MDRCLEQHVSKYRIHQANKLTRIFKSHGNLLLHSLPILRIDSMSFSVSSSEAGLAPGVGELVRVCLSFCVGGAGISFGDGRIQPLFKTVENA